MRTVSRTKCQGRAVQGPSLQRTLFSSSRKLGPSRLSFPDYLNSRLTCPMGYYPRDGRLMIGGCPKFSPYFLEQPPVSLGNSPHSLPCDAHSFPMFEGWFLHSTSLLVARTWLG